LALGVRPTLDVLEGLASRDRFDKVVAYFSESADFDDRPLRRFRPISLITSGSHRAGNPRVGVNARLLDDFDLDAVPVTVIDGKNLW